MAKLTFILEDGQKVVVPLAGVITLGRDDDNDVMIDDERISRHHAELCTREDGRIEVLDLGSTAGTFINDRPIRSHIFKQGDKLAFGPLAAKIDFDDSPALPVAEAISVEEARLAQLQADVQKAETAHRDLLTAIANLSTQQQEKSGAVQQLEDAKVAAQKEIEDLAAQQKQAHNQFDQLTKDCDLGAKQLNELRHELAEVEARSRANKTLVDTHAEQAQIARKNLDELSREQQQTQESLIRIQAEITAAQSTLTSRSEELATETRRLDEARTHRTELEAQCQALATTDQQLADAKTALHQLQAQLAEREISLKQSSATEEAAQNRISSLEAREKEIRAELDALGPNTEMARVELSAIESRLEPLRDWKKSMDRRYARLAAVQSDSTEETAIWHEIEEAYASLLDLLPIAHIETSNLTRSDFSRISTKSGVRMRSERIRRAGS